MTTFSQENPDNIVPFPETEQDSTNRMQEYLLQVVNAAVKVLNARLLCILALLGAIAFWAVAMWEPSELRIACGICYSAGVLFPVLKIYGKKS